MIKWIGFHVIYLAAISGFINCSHSYRRVCYFTNWAQYRPSPYKFKPDNIDPFLCTHIIFAFAEVSGNAIKPFEWNDESTDWSKGNYEKAADLKKWNPTLKILLALGGWNYGVGEFSVLVHNKTDVEQFAVNAVHFLRRINFDGLDLDWEYPGNRGSPSEDKHLYTRFCKILRKTFEIESKYKGHPQLLLTAAVGAGETVVESAYEIAQISKELDFINLMTYDLHGSFESFLGENSPLYARHGESTEQKRLNQDYAVHLWIHGGAPRHKLNLGMALYGRAFTMNNKDHEIGKPAAGAGISGTYTREQGFLSYYEICRSLANGWKRVWNDEQKVPYAYHGDQWVGYDDLESFEIKANYVKKNRLGGTMVWAMDLDDIHGVCGFGINPLQNKLKEVLTGVKVKSLHPSLIHHHVSHVVSVEHKSVKQKPIHHSDELQPHAVFSVKEHLKSSHKYVPKAIIPKKPVICGAHGCGIINKLEEHGERILANTVIRFPTIPSKDEYNLEKPPGYAYFKASARSPARCEDGHYYAEMCDNQVYYFCWRKKANKQRCPPRTVWKESIIGCDLGKHQIVHGIQAPTKHVPSGHHTSRFIKTEISHHDHLLSDEVTTNPLSIEHVHKILPNVHLTNKLSNIHVAKMSPSEYSIKSSHELSDNILSSDHLSNKHGGKLSSAHFVKKVSSTVPKIVPNKHPVKISTAHVHCGPPKHCIHDGVFYSDMCNDKVYYVCSGGKARKRECPPRTVWNEYILTCDTVQHKMSYDNNEATKTSVDYSYHHTSAISEHDPILSAKHAIGESSEHDRKVLSTEHSAKTLIGHATSISINKHTPKEHPKPCGGPKHCKGGRYYVDKCDDTVYYLCWGGNPILKTCPRGTHWDSSITACDWIKISKR